MARKSQPLGLGFGVVSLSLYRLLETFWCISRMVVRRRLVTGSRLGSGAGSQDRPAFGRGSCQGDPPGGDDRDCSGINSKDDWVFQDCYG